MTVIDDPFHDVEVGSRVIAETSPQAFRGEVSGFDDDPEPYDSIEATRRYVVEADQGYTFWLEETTSGRVRVVKPGAAQPALNVSRVEAGG